jgi:hypothetical protein
MNLLASAEEAGGSALERESSRASVTTQERDQVAVSIRMPFAYGVLRVARR